MRKENEEKLTYKKLSEEYKKECEEKEKLNKDLKHQVNGMRLKVALADKSEKRRAAHASHIYLEHELQDPTDKVYRSDNTFLTIIILNQTLSG